MKKDALFELVSSLDKSEKRYFTLYTTLHTNSENNNALRLFNAIKKMNEYNDEQLLQLFQSLLKRPIDIKYLRAAKQYLYGQILKSMRTYRSERSIKMQLKGLLNDVEFLFEKELYKQCEKILSKAIKIAEKYEDHVHLLEFLNWEAELTQVHSLTRKSTKKIEHIFGRMFKTIDTYKNSKEYQYPIALTAAKVKQKGSRRRNTDVQDYQNIINQPLFEDESKALSFKALYFYYVNYNTYFHTLNDFEKAYMYAQKTVEVIESHPHQIQEESTLYLAALRNLIIRQLDLKKYKDVPLTIKKMKAIPAKLKQKKRVIFDLVNNLELNLYINIGQFDKGVNLVPEIKNEWKNRIISVSNKYLALILSYNIACVYFGAKNYTAANSWLNNILNDATIDFRSDILCFSQLLHLIIHYEKNNENHDTEEYIEYRVVTANRFLKNRKQLYQLEKTILNFFKQKFPTINTDQEQINSFKTLKKEIEDILENSFEKTALDYFDFISWIDSKIEGKTYEEVVKRNLEL